MTTISYAGPVIDASAYARANGRQVFNIDDQLHVLKQFSIGQVLAFQQVIQAMEEGDMAGQVAMMIDAVGNHLYRAVGTDPGGNLIAADQPVGRDFVAALDQDIVLFLSNQLTSDKALKKLAGVSREEIAARMGPWADFVVQMTPDAPQLEGSSTHEGVPSASTQP